MMDRYDFASVVDDIFKECDSVEDMVSRYVQMRKDMDSLFRQNIALKAVSDMARYVDADELLNRLPDNLPYKASVKRVLIQTPTADVVPKSKYDNLKMQFDALDCECGRLEKEESEKYDKIIEAKVEVAREIFDDIEKTLLNDLPLMSTIIIPYLKKFKDKYVKESHNERKDHIRTI